MLSPSRWNDAMEFCLVRSESTQTWSPAELSACKVLRLQSAVAFTFIARRAQRAVSFSLPGASMPQFQFHLPAQESVPLATLCGPHTSSAARQAHPPCPRAWSVAPCMRVHSLSQEPSAFAAAPCAAVLPPETHTPLFVATHTPCGRDSAPCPVTTHRVASGAARELQPAMDR